MADPLVETKLQVPRLHHRAGGPSAARRRRARHRPARFADAGLRAGGIREDDAAGDLVGTPRDDARAPSPGCRWTRATGRPASFWSYVLRALEPRGPGRPRRARWRCWRRPQAPLEDVLTRVVNELSVHPGDVTLVLDDYHLADGAEVAAGMALPARPPAARSCSWSSAPAPTRRCPCPGCGPAASSSRSAPPTCASPPTEAAAYLNDLNGLGLAADDVAALEARTEGWVAALQLAALSLRDRDDAAGFIAGFAGDDRFVVDYLADEVLDRQPDDVRRFLLDTSVLDRLTGPLCDAVTAQPAAGGKAVLEPLDRRNLFLVPLDDRRRWYRYHHLFADVLHAHLLAGAARRRRRSCIAGPADWYAEPATSRRRCGTPSPPATSTGPPTSSSWPLPPCGGTGARTSSAAGSTTCPTTSSRDRPVLAIGLHRRADGQQRVRRRRPAARRRRGAAGATDGPSWSWSTATSWPGCRRRVGDPTGPDWRWSPGTRRAPHRTPTRPWPAPATTTCSPPRPPPRSPGLAVLDAGRPGRRARGRTPVAADDLTPPGTSRTCSAAPSRWPT